MYVGSSPTELHSTLLNLILVAGAADRPAVRYFTSLYFSLSLSLSRSLPECTSSNKTKQNKTKQKTQPEWNKVPYKKN